MAVIDLYIRADGDDANSGLVNSSGGAKRTLQGAWDAIPDDPTDDYIINFIGAFDAGSAGAIDLTVPNANNANFLITADATGAVTEPSDAEFDSKARVSGAGDPAVNIGTTNVTIEKIGIRTTDGAAPGVSVGSNDATLRNLIIIASSPNFAIRNGASGLRVVNVAAWAGGGVRNAGTGTYDFVSVLSGDIAAFLNKAGATGAVNGCVAQATGVGAGFADEGDAWTGNWNVSHAADAPGANSLDSETGVFTNEGAGTEDLTLTSAVTYAIVDRTGLPADTDEDIAGTSRPATGADAGAWQNPAAPGGSILPLVACDIANMNDMGGFRG